MSDEKKAKWKQQLAQSRMGLRMLLTSLTPEQWQTEVFSEGTTWTVATIIGHLIEAERGMSIHIHKIRTGRETLPEGFDLNRWNAGIRDRMETENPIELMQALATTRVKTLEVMDSLKDEDWTLTGRHGSRGIITVEQYYETMAGHDRMHTKDIKAALGVE